MVAVRKDLRQRPARRPRHRRTRWRGDLLTGTFFAFLATKGKGKCNSETSPDTDTHGHAMHRYTDCRPDTSPDTNG